MKNRALDNLSSNMPLPENDVKVTRLSIPKRKRTRQATPRASTTARWLGLKIWYARAIRKRVILKTCDQLERAELRKT